MNKLTVGILGAGALAILFVLVIGMYSLGVYNTQKRLLNLYEAKVSANKAELSNLKSKLPEAAQVTDAQMSRLSQLFNGYAQARTPEANGALMRWVQESVPNVDQTTFTNLQNMIASARDSWTARQRELVDVSRVYNTNLDTQPSGLVLSIFGRFDRISPIVIITEGTAKAFATQRDEPMELLKK